MQNRNHLGGKLSKFNDEFYDNFGIRAQLQIAIGERTSSLKSLKRCCFRHLCRHTGDQDIVSLSVTSMKQRQRKKMY